MTWWAWGILVALVYVLVTLVDRDNQRIAAQRKGERRYVRGASRDDQDGMKGGS